MVGRRLMGLKDLGLRRSRYRRSVRSRERPGLTRIRTRVAVNITVRAIESVRKKVGAESSVKLEIDMSRRIGPAHPPIVMPSSMKRVASRMGVVRKALITIIKTSLQVGGIVKKSVSWDRHN